MPTPTTRTLLQLRQDVLSRLNENNNSPVGQLPSGSDGTVTEDTSVAVNRYLNEGARKLARAAYPLVATGTFTTTTTTPTVQNSQFSTADGSGIWAVRVLSVAGVRVSEASRSYAEINSTSAKQTWVKDGSASVSFYPPLASGKAISVTAFAVPPLMVSDTDTPGWLEPDLDYALVYYACAMVCMKAKSQDEVLGGLAQMWMNEYSRVEAMQSARLKATDPALWAAHFAYVLGGK